MPGTTSGRKLRVDLLSFQTCWPQLLQGDCSSFLSVSRGVLGVLLGGSGSVGLVSDDFVDLVSDELSAFVGTSSLASEAHGLLLLDGIASLQHLHHLALEGAESGDLHHDLTDGGDTGVNAALSVRSVLLESVGVLLRLCNDVTLVQADKNSTLLHHLISFKIIKH